MITAYRAKSGSRNEAVRRWMETEIEFVGGTDLAAVTDIDGEVARFMSEPADPIGNAGVKPRATTSRDVASPYLPSMLTAALLKPEREAELFRMMNLCKLGASRLQQQLTFQAPGKRIVDKLERWMALAGEIRNRIVAANVRLVVSVAKKFSGFRHPISELISDGNLTLLRAVEKYDYARGFRFSTYATWALRYHFARTVGKKPSPNRAASAGDDLLAGVPDLRVDLAHERRLAESNLALDGLLARLDPREHAIVLRRFGLMPGCEERSLQEIAREMGVCKERVRQLQLRALDKLKAMAAESRLEPFDPI